MPYIVLDPASAAAAPTPSLAPGPDTAGNHPAGKSLKAMRDRLRIELGNRSDATSTLLNELINDSYLDIFSSLELPESQRGYGQTLVAGQALYALPAGVDTVLSISANNPGDVTTGAGLRKIDWQEYRKLPVRSGPPESWFRSQNIVVFWPTPEINYPVAFDVRVKPALLAADTDYPVIEDKWHEALYKGAKARAWEAVQNDTKAALAENSASRLIQRRSDRDAVETETEYPSMRPIRSKADLMAIRRTHRRIEPGEC